MKGDYKKLPTASEYAKKLESFDQVLYKIGVRKLVSSHEGCLYNVGRFGWNLFNPVTWVVLLVVLVIGLITRSIMAIWEVFVEWVGLFYHECESVINKDREQQ